MRRVILVAALLATLGCEALRPQPEVSADGLVEQTTSGRGALFVRPGAHIGDYDKIWVAQMGIHYARGQEALSDEDENLVYQMLADGLAIDMESDSVVSALEPGPCTLKFGLYITGLEFYESPTVGSQVNFVESFGSMTMVMEFRDSQTDIPLVRYGQKRSLGSGVQEGQIDPDMHRLGLTIDAIMEDVGDQLAEVMPQRADSRAQYGCQGLLGLSTELAEPPGR